MQTKMIHPLDKPAFPWNNGGTRYLWTLADMLKAFRIYDFDKLLTDLRELQDKLDTILGQTAPCDKVHPYWDHYASKAQEILDQVAKVSDALGLKPSYERAIKTSVLAGEEGIPLVELHARIRDMREVLEDEIRCKLFLYLPPFGELYFNSTALFGEKVEQAFSLSRYDLKEAGNCFALELYTACVFHLMRVLERGLRALAQYVGVPCGHECWGDIIKDINAKLAEPDRSPRTPEKEARRQFCAEAATQFFYFKDAWRNYVMHDWDYYQKEDAEKIMQHVRDFMQHLAERLSYPGD
jgi:hypothetical protein